MTVQERRFTRTGSLNRPPDVLLAALEVNRLVRNTDVDTATLMEKEDYLARQLECEQLMKNGILDKAPRGFG
jgi:hypothetical protein